MNKKGFVAEIAAQIWAIIAYIVILFLFYMIFAAQNSSLNMNIKTDIDTMHATIALKTFLNTNMVVDNKDISVSDAIKVWYLSDNSSVSLNYQREIANKYNSVFTFIESKKPIENGEEKPGSYYLGIFNENKNKNLICYRQICTLDKTSTGTVKNFDECAESGDYILPVSNDEILNIRLCIQ